jgi:hypothetical protein
VLTQPSLPLYVGIGLDGGEAVPVQGGYRGGALNLAARLCSIAATGEVFASESVVHLARHMDAYVYLDRGQVKLKGVAEPVRVVQIVPESEAQEERTRYTVDPTAAIRLPVQPNPFIGRERELRVVTGALLREDIRLLTLTGTGGTGKTRLGLEAAREVAVNFPDGVYFVNLAPLADPQLVVPAIAETLGVKEVPEESLIETMTRALRDRQLLLMLDNFEHLLAAAPVVSELLTGCPGLTVLVTSRAALHLSAEHEYAVRPLSLPDLRKLPELGALSQYDAVALFIQRALAVKSDFQVSNQNAPAVAEICSRLDGLPLAIELAAARLKLFPPQVLLSRLQRRLPLLTGGSSDLPARHQTLRATIDWSYSLLSEEEQRLFARLSVFAGGSRGGVQLRGRPRTRCTGGDCVAGR